MRPPTPPMDSYLPFEATLSSLFCHAWRSKEKAGNSRRSMEIAAALVGAAATAAASKLSTMIDNRSCGETEKADAETIKSEVGLINAFIKDSYTAKGLSALQTECIGQLRRLACDIEDCVELLGADKSKDWADEIGRLKTRSSEMRERLLSYLGIAQGTVAGASKGAVVQTSQGAVAGTSQGAAVLPTELQAVVDNPELVKNLDCLLYLCLFPPKHHVRTKPLMRRWMAEGLVQGEDMAVKNLHFFIGNSIIKSIQTSNDGEVKTCQPTGEMHACISEKSKSQNFVLVYPSPGNGTTSKLELADEAYRLSVHPSANAQLELPQNLSRVRTLAVFPADDANLASYEAVLDFSSYKVLRVLDLKECAQLEKKHLNKILDDIIVHHRQVLMKYLSINLGSIHRISRSIKNLNQLETLDLSGTRIMTVFEEVLLLPNLKHLLGKFQFSKIETIYKSVSGLKDFLSDKSKLETLAGFVIGKRYGFAELIILMKSLRKVKIWCKSKPRRRNMEVLSSAITKFIRHGTDAPHCGRSLSMDFAKCSKEFMNDIVVVPGILASLKLRGKLSQFPPFVRGLSDIRELCLCFTGLSWEVIRDGLSTVKGLKYLKLVENKLERINIKPDHLRSITRISLVSVPTLELTIKTDALPRLVSLHILCQNLKVSPGSSPSIEIKHMKELEEIALHPQVASGIKAQWQQAASVHPHKSVRVIDGA